MAVAQRARRPRRGPKLVGTSVQLEPRIIKLLDERAREAGAGTARADIIRRILNAHFASPATEAALAVEAAS